MQQGGMSKATKTLNVSEDIFAGMDFVLRGEGRRVLHREYFHLAKGRDLGFNTVLAFFMKLSSGTGEQLLTRQTCRLGQLLPLPELLSFYYAHMGYYVTQWLVSCGLPLITMVWLVVILNGCETSNDLSMQCSAGTTPAALVVAQAWESVFSKVLMLAFLVAQVLPLFCELWLQAGLVTAICRILKQLFTLSPLMFIFKAKVIGFYTVNELRFGGATYVATGRGLPTERRPFIGSIAGGELVVGGLYLDYARHTYYDGMKLLCFAALVVLNGGTDGSGDQLVAILASLGLTIVSWLFAPFIFNPYQFRPKCFLLDIRASWRFFIENGGDHYKTWYVKDQLKPLRGIRATVLDVSFGLDFFFLVLWLASLNAKILLVDNISATFRTYYLIMLLPPIFLPMAFCLSLVAFGKCCPQRDADGEDYTPLQVEEARTRGPRGPLQVKSESENKSCQCYKRLPLVVVSAAVTMLTILEIVQPVLWLRQIGWSKTFFIAVMMKLYWLQLVKHIAMTVIRSSCFKAVGFLGRPVELWVFSSSMVRDIIVSTFILCILSPLVFLSLISGILCPTFSIHHLIVYRQPGHAQRQEAEFSRGRSAASDDELSDE